jgi:hypothetical protein
MPKDVELNSARDLTKLHLHLLKEMEQKAEMFIKDHHPNVQFKCV